VVPEREALPLFDRKPEEKKPKRKRRKSDEGSE
jgi:hypothetical protein